MYRCKTRVTSGDCAEPPAPSPFVTRLQATFSAFSIIPFSATDSSLTPPNPTQNQPHSTALRWTRPPPRTTPTHLAMSLLCRLPRDAARLVLARNHPRHVTINAIGTRNEKLNRYLEVSEEVRSAVARKAPVVALETAILTHGGCFSTFRGNPDI